MAYAWAECAAYGSGDEEVSEPNQDTELYSLVATEMEGSDYNKGLWAKCFAECEGDGNKAKALYLKERIEQLKEQSFPLHHVNSTNSPDSDKPAEEQHEYAALVDISINLKVEFGLDIVPVQSGFYFNVYDEDAELCNRLYGHCTFKQGEHTLTGFPVKAIDTFEESFVEHRLSYAFVEQDPADSSVRSVTASSNKLALDKFFTK